MCLSTKSSELARIMEGYVVLSLLYFRQLAFILQLGKNLGVMEHFEFVGPIVRVFFAECVETVWA